MRIQVQKLRRDGKYKVSFSFNKLMRQSEVVNLHKTYPGAEISGRPHTPAQRMDLVLETPPRYDYDLQCWYNPAGIVQDCNHPPGQKETMIDGQLACCDQRRWAGKHRDVALKYRQNHS